MPILQQLRLASQPAHRAIEQQPWLRALLRPTLDMATYCKVLHCFRLFYKVADAHLACSPLPAFTDYRYEPRAPYLIADCQALSDFYWPPFEPLPELHSAGDLETLIGRLYVIEGSSQGGQIIQPRVKRTLHMEGTDGLEFFTYFTQAGNQWPNFKSLVQTLEADSDRGLQWLRIRQQCIQFFTDLDKFMGICNDAWCSRSQHG